MAPTLTTADTATNEDLDAILATQLTVAWAGETVSGEERFGWWRTELTDPEAGGDFLARLLPRTHAWAALAAAREAARRVDETARRRSPGADAMWSLFHYGFAVDERLDARLGELRRGDASPAAALGEHLVIRERFDRPAFTTWLRGLGDDVRSEKTPAGRKLRGRPASLLLAARNLAAALHPFVEEYPLPFFATGGP